MEITTKYCTIADSDMQDKISGDEEVEFFGSFLTPLDVKNLWKKMKGLNVYFNCVEKSLITARYLFDKRRHIKHCGRISIKIGSLFISSAEGNGRYGFTYNRPFEFHSWVCAGDSIIDFSLPGVILAGSKMSDSIGKIISGRKPMVMNSSSPPNWVEYIVYETYHEDIFMWALIDRERDLNDR